MRSVVEQRKMGGGGSGAQALSAVNRQVRAMREAVRQDRQEDVKAASSEVALAGTGDIDNRRMLTSKLQNMRAVQKGSGMTETGSLAYSTNSLSWRDYNPGYFDGPFAPPGQYNAQPYYAAGATPDPNVTVKAVQPVAVNRAQAGQVTTNVLQNTDVW